MDINKKNDTLTDEIKDLNLREETVNTLSHIEKGLRSIQSEQADDNDYDRQVDFLTDCMEENLEHARHVENERMNFIQIHLVLVGGVLAILAESAFKSKSLVVLIILISITLLGFFIKVLINRWDQVFAAHRSCAMYCYIRIMEICNLTENSMTEFPIKLLPEVKRNIPAEYRSSMPFYPFTFSESGKTGTLIRWFTNGLICVTAVVAAGYFLTFWVLPAM